MATYQIAQPCDREELIDFGNFVFSQAHCPHDFKKIAPKVYGDDTPSDVMAACHYIAKENGRIKALIGCPTFPFHVGAEKLVLGAVGTVSVHPYSRGAGYMRALMHMLIDDMRAKGVDMLVLGGQRQRYNYYGYEHAGKRIAFHVSATNLRHAFGGANPNGLRFDELTKNDARIKKAAALYHGQALHADRPLDRFCDILHTWEGTPYAVMRDEEMLGYLVASKERNDVNELVLERESDLTTVIGAWIALAGLKEIGISVGEWETERMGILAKFAEWVHASSEEMILPLNWANCLRAAFAEKAMFTNLEDGTQTYCLDGQTVRVTVKDNKATVEDAPGEKADLTLAGTEAVSTFYSPIGSYLRNNQWLPLSFNMPSLDKF